LREIHKGIGGQFNPTRPDSTGKKEKKSAAVGYRRKLHGVSGKPQGKGGEKPSHLLLEKNGPPGRSRKPVESAAANPEKR